MPRVCEKVSGSGIPARNRRSSAAKCVVQIDFAENYTCASDSIHKGRFGVVRVHGVQDPPATMLHLSPCLQVTALIFLNRSGRKFSIVDPKEWLVDKVDILRILAQPSLDNRVGYDFGELDIYLRNWVNLLFNVYLLPCQDAVAMYQ